MSKTKKTANQNYLSFRLSLLLLIISFFYCSKIVIHRKIKTETSFPNWIMYGGNLQRTNAYPLAIDLPLKLVWQKKTSAAIGKTLIVADSVIYFSTLDGKISAINIATGEKIGEKKFTFASTCAYHDHHLIIARRYGDDTIFNLDLDNSKLMWHTDAGDIASEPLLTSNSVIVTALYNHIDLYTIDSGIKIWTFKTKGQIRSSPAMAQDKIIFGCDDSHIYAVSSTTGRLIWKFKTKASVQATPSINLENKIAYIGSSDNNFYALNFENGKEVWKFRTNGQILNGAAISNQLVLFGSTDKNIYCLNSKTGELLWTITAKSVISTSPLIAGDIVFWGSLDHFVYAANINNGQLLWKYKAKGRIRTTPVVWDNYFIAASEDNYIYVFQPERK